MAAGIALALSTLCALAATPSPWQALAPTMFNHLVPAERGFPSPVTMSVAQNNRVNLAYELALRHRPSHEPVVPGTQTRSNCKSLICDGFLVLLFVSN